MCAVNATTPIDLDRPRELDIAIDRAASALMERQAADGHWVFELEADATIPAEYVLLNHYLGDCEPDIEAGIGRYLRRIQGADGGWPLVAYGDGDISATVKAYFALKMIGDSPDTPHMTAARNAALQRGGAAHANVFTRMLLALYGVVPWTAVPVMPVEMLLLPRWFPVHLNRMSYWSRTVLVPLLVLQALKPRARNPRGIGIDELFIMPPSRVAEWPKGPQDRWPWAGLFRGIDAVLRPAEPHWPERLRKRAIGRAVAFVRKRLNGEDGLGGIFPAIANVEMMFDALGYDPKSAERTTTRRALWKLLCGTGEEIYCQPCLSPVWDTALACHALMEVGTDEALAHTTCGLDWLADRQVLDVRGDWSVKRGSLRPGGWAFQYANPHYPDVDDTAVVVMAMDRARRGIPNVANRYGRAIDRGREWVIGMQSRDGGWAAFDADNTAYYLNSIPFADHGALLDPPTADVTARCIGMLAQLGCEGGSGLIGSALRCLERTQEADGSWYGRWGMNYIYGTWSVLNALGVARVDPRSPIVRRAIEWLIRCQNRDGGWGEDARSYDHNRYEASPSTVSQTAWALLGLMAVGEEKHPAVGRGVTYLLESQAGDGFWPEERYTATGFPRVFYLRYHGYSKYFPLWALARFRNLTRRTRSGTTLNGI